MVGIIGSGLTGIACVRVTIRRFRTLGLVAGAGTHKASDWHVVPSVGTGAGPWNATLLAGRVLDRLLVGRAHVRLPFGHGRWMGECCGEEEEKKEEGHGAVGFGHFSADAGA